MHIYTHVCTCICIHHIHMYMAAHSYIHTCIYMHTPIHTHIHVYIATCLHTRSYIPRTCMQTQRVATLNYSPNATDITGRAELNINNIIQLLMIYTIMKSSLRAYNTFSKPLSLRCCVILAVVWIILEYYRTQPLMLP